MYTLTNALCWRGHQSNSGLSFLARYTRRRRVSCRRLFSFFRTRERLRQIPSCPCTNASLPPLRGKDRQKFYCVCTAAAEPDATSFALLLDSLADNANERSLFYFLTNGFLFFFNDSHVLQSGLSEFFPLSHRCRLLHQCPTQAWLFPHQTCRLCPQMSRCSSPLIL